MMMAGESMSTIR
jgi:hypothetical protein